MLQIEIALLKNLRDNKLITQEEFLKAAQLLEDNKLKKVS